MIRILHVIPTLDRAGAEKQLTLLASRLPRGEFDVHVCALTRGGPYEQTLAEAGVPVSVLRKKGKIDPLAYARLVRLMRRLQPDVVHTWLFAGNAYGRSAARRAAVPVVLATERCVDAWKAWYELAIDRRLARRTDRIVVNSRGVAEFYRRQGIAPELLTVIYNGVETPPPPLAKRGVGEVAPDHVAAGTPAPCAALDLRHELGIPPEGRVVGCIGRLWAQKRVSDLLWAAELLRAMRGDVYLLVVGDGPERSMLEGRAKDFGVAPFVRFLGQRDDVPRLLEAIEVLWLASSFEGLPNSVLEAMAAARPVVGTDIPGTNEVVVHGETGFLVPVGDRAALARQTDRLLKDPELAHRMGEAGRRRVCDHFSVEAMVARHAALYRELVETRRDRRSPLPPPLPQTRP